jgi:hypothetical protein
MTQRISDQESGRRLIQSLNSLVEQRDGPDLVPLWPDFANEINVGKSLAYKLANDGTIPVIRLGRLLKVNMVAWRKRLESAA